MPLLNRIYPIITLPSLLNSGVIKDFCIWALFRTRGGGGGGVILTKSRIYHIGFKIY